MNMIKDLKFENETLTDLNFVDYEFENCVIDTCTIHACYFANCHFKKCTIINPNANLSVVKYCMFTQCNLIGVSWGLFKPETKTMCSFQSIKDCYLKYNTFMDMNLKSLDFSDNTFQESLFDTCNLSKSKFNRCRFEHTQFFNSDLRKADFRDALDYIVDIESNKLKDSRFSFPEVMNLLDTLGIKID